MRAEEHRSANGLLADLAAATTAAPVLTVRGRARGVGALLRRALVGADLLGLALAYVGTRLITGADLSVGGAEAAVGAGALLAWIVGAQLYGLYDHDQRRPEHSTLDDVGPLFHLATVGIWLAFAAVMAAGLAHPAVGATTVFWALAIAFPLVIRTAARAAVRRGSHALQNAIVVGAGDVGQLIARKFILRSEYGVNVVGFVDIEPRDLDDDLDHLAYLGRPDELPRLVRLLDVERVVFAFWDEPDDQAPLQLIRALRDLDVEIDIAPRLYDIIGPNVAITTVAGFPLVGLPSLRLSRSARLTKRAMDIVVSAAALVVCAPLLALVAVLIKLDSPGRVFFRQVRMGARDRVFSVYKFRTMVPGADGRKNELAHLNEHARGGDDRLFKVADDPRVTRVGRVLRRYFLDELPQLINVLKGEMSLVGPRPLILDEDRHVDDWARRRLDLRPGMTGLWQVLGHRAIPFGEMMKLDYLYVTTWSLRNDIRLIGRTIPVVLRGGGGTY